MTPNEEQRLLDGVAGQVEEAAQASYQTLREAIRQGEPARDAVAATYAAFVGEYSGIMAGAMTEVLGASVGRASVLAMRVGPVTMAQRLYAHGEEVGRNVAAVVQRHAQGFQDARRLALELYEGYDFRPAGAEPLQISKRNPVLPRYLRQLLEDPDLGDELARYYARVQAAGRKTEALRASYLALLDEMEAGRGEEALARRLEVAYQEKVRYHANRIAQTELHRAYAVRQARELMDDTDVEIVQWRLSPTHPQPDICDYFAQVDLYGLGPGLYPKGAAPVAPLHPFCRCYLKFRTDLRLGTVAKARFRPEAGRAFVDGLGLQEGVMVMGSRAKLEAVANGADPMAVFNAARRPEYAIRTVEQAAGAWSGWSGLGMGKNPAMDKHPRAIPGAENAVISPSKLTAYALNKDHPVGGHKARVLAAATGFTAEKADVLVAQIRQGLPTVEAVEREANAYGRLFSADIPVTGPVGAGTVRTGWLLEKEANAPKLVTLYLLKEKS